VRAHAGATGDLIDVPTGPGAIIRDATRACATSRAAAMAGAASGRVVRSSQCHRASRASRGPSRPTSSPRRPAQAHWIVHAAGVRVVAGGAGAGAAAGAPVATPGRHRMDRRARATWGRPRVGAPPCLQAMAGARRKPSMIRRSVHRMAGRPALRGAATLPRPRAPAMAAHPRARARARSALLLPRRRENRGHRSSGRQRRRHHPSRAATRIGLNERSTARTSRRRSLSARPAAVRRRRIDPRRY